MTNENEFLKVVKTTIRDALKLKQIMLKRNLTQARAKCPECEGMLYGALVGSKKHMRMYCTGSCKRQMME